MKGFIKIRYGLIEHWEDMTDGERILFVTYLMRTRFRGQYKGFCPMTDEDMAVYLSWDIRKLKRHKRALRNRKFISTTQGKPGVYIPKYDMEHRTPVSHVDNSMSHVDNSNSKTKKEANIGHQRTEVMSHVMSHVVPKKSWFSKIYSRCRLYRRNR